MPKNWEFLSDNFGLLRFSRRFHSLSLVREKVPNIVAFDHMLTTKVGQTAFTCVQFEIETVTFIQWTCVWLSPCDNKITCGPLGDSVRVLSLWLNEPGLGVNLVCFQLLFSVPVINIDQMYILFRFYIQFYLFSFGVEDRLGFLW